MPADEPRLVHRMTELATTYGRYGYRRITGLLRGEGWSVNHKRIERLWRREGLKVPQKQPKRGRLWLADGSCVRRWLDALGVQTLFIEPGSPWENGYVASFNGKLRDELLDREIFYTLTEAKILIERWRREYNTVRPHSALGYRPPAPDAIMPATFGSLEMSPALS